jgi:hypothetical protein
VNWSEGPVVIGGCGRSGTTLLLSVLSGHPSIAAVPRETYALCPNVWRHGAGASTPDLVILGDALSDLTPPPTARRWCEKTPKNVTNVGAILHALPDARFLHVVRDGRDVVTSVYPGRTGYHTSKERWVRDVSAGLEHRDDPRVLLVRYEDLVLNFERTVRVVCDHLGEDCPPEVLAYPEHETVGYSEAWGHGAIPLHTGSIGRWRGIEHQNRVIALANDEHARALMGELDYELGEEERWETWQQSVSA